jgi:hypothetical protein
MHQNVLIISTTDTEADRTVDAEYVGALKVVEEEVAALAATDCTAPISAVGFCVNDLASVGMAATCCNKL